MQPEITANAAAKALTGFFDLSIFSAPDENLSISSSGTVSRDLIEGG